MNERTLALLATWFFCTAAMAASEVQPIYLHQLPWLSILVAGAIAIWGGLTQCTLRKLTKEQVVWAALRDAFVASGAGFVMFNLAMWVGWNIWLMSASIYIAGFLGARFLSAVGERLLDAVRSVGKTTTTTTDTNVNTTTTTTHKDTE